jgi:hypothetical protein
VHEGNWCLHACRVSKEESEEVRRREAVRAQLAGITEEYKGAQARARGALQELKWGASPLQCLTSLATLPACMCTTCMQPIRLFFHLHAPQLRGCMQARAVGWLTRHGKPVALNEWGCFTHKLHNRDCSVSI